MKPPSPAGAGVSGRKLLCVSRGLPSVVYPALELARRLAAAGHRVVFAGQAETRQLAGHHGLEFLELEASRYEEFLAEDAAAGPIRRALDLGRRRARARGSLAVDGFRRAVGELRPDLALVNGEMHEQVFAAAAAGAPVALLNTFVSIWRRPGLPPPHCAARPGVGWWGSRPGIGLLWLAAGLRKRLRARWLWLRHLGCDRRSVLRSLAREVGFDFRRETDSSQWLVPFTYRRLPVLSLHALEIELPHRPPPGVRYVGPMVLESRIDRPLPRGDRARLDAILGRGRRAGGDRTLIYAGFGSAFTAGRERLQSLLAVVKDRPGWDLLVSLSGRPAPAELGPLPAGVHLFSWLPQLEVLARADAAINHGGIGTIDECVLHGVPMLVYSGGETDMAGATARVAHHGIGIAGGRRDGAAEVGAHLDRLLGEPAYRAAGDRLRARFAAYAEDRVAERAVAELLAAGRCPPPAAAPRRGGNGP